MPRKKEPKPFRNVPKAINEELLKRMSMRHSTLKEMAECLGVHPDTLRDRYSSQIEAWRSEGKLDIREEQWRIMKKGSADMAKFLGQEILGQGKRSEVSEEAKSILVNFVDVLAQHRRGQIDPIEDLPASSSHSPIDFGTTD